MPLQSMPLAAGYLKAVADADPVVGPEMDVEILSFRGGESLGAMARAVLAPGAPDVLACSVLGWNFSQFGALAETYRSVRPDGWVVFGGTHVAHQSERVFRLFPAVDVVVDGEGDLLFTELLRAHLEGVSRHDLGHIPGLSYRLESGAGVSTGERPRIDDLGVVPSPFLSGAIPLRDARGRFPYDVALMETNRGCPYRCAFCYWGGAVGQRVRAFPRERLREELELFGFHEISTVVLCDANFGMRRADADFVEDLVRTREKYGYPRSLETSWSKNKSPTFHRIVQRMRETGLQSSFTLALQTLDEAALESMDRRNMRINRWEELAAWLAAEGLDCYAELIWGAPGETLASFLEGYDRLARHVSRIAVYPLLLLPNTAYAESRDDHGFVTVRGDADDFEYVLANRTISMEDNAVAQRFMFWARSMSENLFFRHIWGPLRDVAGLRQTEVLLSLSDWFDRCDDPAAVELLGHGREFTDSALVAAAARRLYGDARLAPLFARWWQEDIHPQLPAEHAAWLDEVFRYDGLTRPVYDPAGADPPVEEGLVDGRPGLLRRDVRFAYPVHRILAGLCRGETVVEPPEPAPVTLTFAYPVGFEDYVDNHEMSAHFVGRWIEEREPQLT